jgi:hypothetical protein
VFRRLGGWPKGFGRSANGHSLEVQEQADGIVKESQMASSLFEDENSAWWMAIDEEQVAVEEIRKRV